MFGIEPSIFPKHLKIDDYDEPSEQNTIRIFESSNLLLGTGARTSNAAVILAKCIHNMIEEGAIELEGKTVLELGAGVGLLGVYLACIGVNVVMGDLPVMKELGQKNINMNKKLLKAKATFELMNWKQTTCINKCEQQTEGKSSTTSSDKPECLKHIIQKIDYTIVCECGGLSDLEYQLNWLGKQGMILCFLSRQTELFDDFLERRSLEEYLCKRDFHYERIQNFHPDYKDQRICIYHVYQ